MGELGWSLHLNIPESLGVWILGAAFMEKQVLDRCSLPITCGVPLCCPLYSRDSSWPPKSRLSDALNNVGYRSRLYSASFAGSILPGPTPSRTELPSPHSFLSQNLIFPIHILQVIYSPLLDVVV